MPSIVVFHSIKTVSAASATQTRVVTGSASAPRRTGSDRRAGHQFPGLLHEARGSRLSRSGAGHEQMARSPGPARPRQPLSAAGCHASSARHCAHTRIGRRCHRSLPAPTGSLDVCFLKAVECVRLSFVESPSRVAPFKCAETRTVSRFGRIQSCPADERARSSKVLVKLPFWSTESELLILCPGTK